jgi:hypothetical protein
MAALPQGIRRWLIKSRRRGNHDDVAHQSWLDYGSVVAGSIDSIIRTPPSHQLFDSRKDSAPHRGTSDIACFQELIRRSSGIEASLVAVPVNCQLGRPIDVAIGSHAAMPT